MNTIEYYDQNAQEFIERTVDVDLGPNYAAFLPHLPPGGRILDAGCGSGRDTLYFKGQGFSVTAFDASTEMVRASSQLTGNQTLQLRFQDLTFHEEFDAIWANASLLHIPYEELSLVMQKLQNALKPSGILYATYKYGEGRREADRRIFYDMNEEKIVPYLRPYFNPLVIRVSEDTRSFAPSPSKAWLHILARKN